MDFFTVEVVTGSDVKAGTNGKGINYSSIWHVFKIKNSLRNRGNRRNNEKVVYFSVANTVSYQNRAYFDVTSGNFAKLGSETVHKDSANTRYITIFLRRIQILKIFKVPTEFIYAL